MALGAHSDYLLTQFTALPASEVVSIDLQHYHSEHVIAVVKYIYTGELELNRESVGPIWQLGEGLGIRTIGKLCEDYFGSTNPQNAIYHFAIAETYRLADLSSRIYQFILARYRNAMTFCQIHARFM